MAGTDRLVDIDVDPQELRRRYRRAAFRFGLPVGGVVLVVLGILAIALYTDRANRAGVLSLSQDLLAQLQGRITSEVSSYIDPAQRAVLIARDVAGLGLAVNSELLAGIAGSVLRRVPQIDQLSFADEDGNYLLVRRGAENGTALKVIRNSPPPREVALIRRDAAGREISHTLDPNDGFDPRERPWYTGALHTEGVFWTSVYLFFTEKAPGVTASIRVQGPDNRVHVVGADIMLNQLARFLASLHIGRTGQAVIIAHDGTLIGLADPTRMLGEENGQTVALRIDQLNDPALTAAWDRFRVEGYGGRTMTAGGQRYITVVNPLSAGGNDWLLMVVVPEADFLGFLGANTRTALAMSLPIVALVAALAALLARQSMRADSAARLLQARSATVSRQSEAFARLAECATSFDPASGEPPPGLTETLVDVCRAQRASVWSVVGTGEALRAVDSFERAGSGHVAGLELTREEVPQSVAALLSGETLDVADMAADRRTAPLYRVLMDRQGRRSLLAVPVQSEGRVVGSVWVEDAEAGVGIADFVQAAANMLAPHMAATLAHAYERPRALAPVTPEPDVVRTTNAELAARGLDPAALAADVYPDVAVLTVYFSDPSGRAAVPVMLADQIACAAQAVCAESSIPYVKLVGHELVAANGFGASDPNAAMRLADVALALRDRCSALFEDVDLAPTFRIGLDCGIAFGSLVGDAPRLFNLWGEAVRTSADMAETAPEAGIQVTEAAYRRLNTRYLLRPRGSFYLPAIGASRTFVLGGRL